MPIYTNRPMAEKYWEKNLRFEEFHSTKKKQDYEREDSRYYKEWCF
jgi:hypothetical protein